MDRTALEYIANSAVHEPVKSETSESELLTIPSNRTLVSLEKHQEAPNRIRQSAKLFSAKSFCDYVNRFKQDSSTVYLDVDSGRFSAVIDHHEPGTPSWCSHKAIFRPKLSMEWSAWTRIHKKPLTQIDLAQFIEEMLDSIVEPEPNVMLKSALDFQSNEKLALGSTTNLDDGSTRFNFTKDNVSKSVTFPHRIKISIPLHENEPRQTLEGRVRYRTDGDGQLTFKFSFVKDPETIQRNALLTLGETIREGVNGLDQYEGALPE